MSNYLALYDYRCQVAAMYRARAQALLDGVEPPVVWQQFRQAREQLFATHPQSALDAEQQRTFQGLPYFPYNPAFCVSAEVDTNIEPATQEVLMNTHETMHMTTVGRLHFTVEGQPVTLSFYWLDIYGGGLFLPFRDTTCPAESYGGGRYLFDTIKGSDFLPVPGEQHWQRIMLDFNYAYNPSCAYNSRWTCPLAPLENRLNIPIRAGELKYISSL
jgi:uncharacterized protein